MRATLLKQSGNPQRGVCLRPVELAVFTGLRESWRTARTLRSAAHFVSIRLMDGWAMQLRPLGWAVGLLRGEGAIGEAPGCSHSQERQDRRARVLCGVPGQEDSPCSWSRPSQGSLLPGVGQPGQTPF